MACAFDTPGWACSSKGCVCRPPEVLSHRGPAHWVPTKGNCHSKEDTVRSLPYLHGGWEAVFHGTAWLPRFPFLPLHGSASCHTLTLAGSLRAAWAGHMGCGSNPGELWSRLPPSEVSWDVLWFLAQGADWNRALAADRSSLAPASASGSPRAGALHRAQHKADMGCSVGGLGTKAITSQREPSGSREGGSLRGTAHGARCRLGSWEG